MFSAAIRSLSNIFSKPFRRIFWKSLGLTILLFIFVFVVLEAFILFLASFPWPWLETVTAVGTGLSLFVSFFYLMGPVTALFAGLYLDKIAEIVEINDYPEDPLGKELDTISSIITGVQFGLIVLLVNLILLPTLLFGFGALLMVVSNAYLLGREYFELVAMRHLKVQEAKAMRRSHSGRIFVAGLLPACINLIPIVNIFVPIFATAYFAHIFKAMTKRNL